MTSNDVKLNDLESTLKLINARLDQEINDNPNNINTYDSSSISIIVYEEGYIDYGARTDDYKENLSLEAYRDVKFALYEEKVRDSDNALVQALRSRNDMKSGQLNTYKYSNHYNDQSLYKLSMKYKNT